MANSTELEGSGFLVITHKLLDTFLHYILNCMEAEKNQKNPSFPY